MKIILTALILFSPLVFANRKIEIGIASNFSELSTVSFNPFGGYFKDAVSMALSDKSSQLKRAGLDIDLKVFDYGIDDMNILRKFEEANSSNVLAVIGYNYSSSALIAAPLHVRNNLPMISPSASATRLSTFGRYVHLGSFSNEYMANTLAKLATAKLQKKKVLIVTATNCAYCVDLAATFSNEFVKLGGLVVKNLPIIQEDQEYSKVAMEAAKLDFDLVFVPNQELTSARLISSFIQAGIKRPFIGADGWGNEGSEFFRVLKGKDFLGYSVTHWYPGLKGKNSSRFVSSYLKRFKKLPNDTSALAYDSACMLIETLISSKASTREELENALQKVKSFKGVTGTYSWEANKAPSKEIIILKTSDSKFVYDSKLSAQLGKRQ